MAVPTSYFRTRWNPSSSRRVLVERSIVIVFPNSSSVTSGWTGWRGSHTSGRHDCTDARGRVQGLTLPGALVDKLSVLEPDGGVTGRPIELGGRPLQEGADGLAAVPIPERDRPVHRVVGDPVIGASDPRQGTGDGERLLHRLLDPGAHPELLEGPVPLPLTDADPYLSVQERVSLLSDRPQRLGPGHPADVDAGHPHPWKDPVRRGALVVVCGRGKHRGHDEKDNRDDGDSHAVPGCPPSRDTL